MVININTKKKINTSNNTFPFWKINKEKNRLNIANPIKRNLLILLNSSSKIFPLNNLDKKTEIIKKAKEMKIDLRNVNEKKFLKKIEEKRKEKILEKKKTKKKETEKKKKSKEDIKKIETTSSKDKKEKINDSKEKSQWI